MRLLRAFVSTVCCSSYPDRSEKESARVGLVLFFFSVHNNTLVFYPTSDNPFSTLQSFFLTEYEHGLATDMLLSALFVHPCPSSCYYPSKNVSLACISKLHPRKITLSAIRPRQRQRRLHKVDAPHRRRRSHRRLVLPR